MYASTLHMTFKSPHIKTRYPWIDEKLCYRFDSNNMHEYTQKYVCLQHIQGLYVFHLQT